MEKRGIAGLAVVAIVGLIAWQFLKKPLTVVPGLVPIGDDVTTVPGPTTLLPWTPIPGNTITEKANYLIAEQGAIAVAPGESAQVVSLLTKAAIARATYEATADMLRQEANWNGVPSTDPVYDNPQVAKTYADLKIAQFELLNAENARDGYYNPNLDKASAYLKEAKAAGLTATEMSTAIQTASYAAPAPIVPSIPIPKQESYPGPVYTPEAYPYSAAIPKGYFEPY